MVSICFRQSYRHCSIITSSVLSPEWPYVTSSVIPKNPFSPAFTMWHVTQIWVSDHGPAKCPKHLNDTCKFLLMGMIKFKTVSSGVISALTRHFSRLLGVKVKMSRTLLGHVLESLSQRKTLKTVKVIEGLLDVPLSLSCYRWQSFVEYESDSTYTAGTLALLSSMKPDSSDSLWSPPTDFIYWTRYITCSINQELREVLKFLNFHNYTAVTAQVQRASNCYFISRSLLLMRVGSLDKTFIVEDSQGQRVL